MKTLFLTCACLIFMACQSNTQQQVNLKTTKDSVSYSLGMDIGNNIKTQKLDVDIAVMAKGLQDYFDSAHHVLKVEQCQQILSVWRTELMKKQQAEVAIQGEKNKKDGETFLAENKTKEGVVVLPSGLQYKVLKEGNGPKPTAEQSVSVNFTGTLIDGTEFENSYKQGQPVTFQLRGVIAGWTEGLQLMSVGAKYKFYIPPELGFGERGTGGSVPPNATLIFEVELLDIIK